MQTGYDTVVTKSQKKRHLYWKSETLLLVGAMYCETWAFYNHLFFLVTVDSEACEQQTHFPSSLLWKRRPEMRPLFAGYRFSRLLKFFRKIILLSYPVKTEIVVDRRDFSDESSLLGNITLKLLTKWTKLSNEYLKIKKNDLIMDTVRSDDVKVLKSNWNVV